MSNPSNIWTFTNGRSDGKIAVVFDNNLWNWLFDHRIQIDCRSALPLDAFALYIPREVEIEHQAIAETHAT